MSSKLRTMPLTASAWLRALNDLDDSSSVRNIDKENGTETWTSFQGQADSRPQRFTAWNANSIFKRMRMGNLADLLKDITPDVLHVSEIKGSTDRCDVRELQAALAALGYTHVVWNWAVASPGNHGSAVFSKHPMRVQFGLGEDSDTEGRTITCHFGGLTVIWTYTPCGTMTTAADDRRLEYDRALLLHTRRMQEMVGQDRVIIAGDRNTAPRPEDCTLPPASQHAWPSCKRDEREAHQRLKALCGLGDVAEAHGDTRMTWGRSKSKAHPAIAMRIDIVLAPLTSLPGHDTGGDFAVTSYAVSSEKYGSDHHAVSFNVDYGKTAPRSELRAAHSPAPAAAMTRAPTVTGTPDPAQPTTKGTRRAKAAEAIAYVERKELKAYRQSRRVRSDWVELPPLDAERADDLFGELAMMVDECRGQPAAPMAAAIPVTDSYDIGDSELPHFEEKVMPETNLMMGAETPSIPVLAMWDSGSFYNIMKTSTAREMGARVDVNARLPCMSLANEHVVRASGKVRVAVDFGGKVMTVAFYTMDELAYPAIIGSHFAVTKGAVTDRGEANEVRLEVAGEIAHVPFKDRVVKRTHADVDMMYATETFVVPANGVRNIPLRFDDSRRGFPDQWGVMVDAKVHGVAVATGFACVMADDQDEAHYYCQVTNPHDRPVVIDTGRPVALFKPCASHLADDFMIIDGEDFINAAPANVAAPAGPGLNAADLEKEWTSRPHLKDLDLSVARRNMSAGGLLRLKRHILDNHELWDTRPKEPPPTADTCVFEVAEGAEWSAKTRPLNPPMRQQLREITKEQLAKRIIEPSTSRFSSAVVLVPKKGGGMRFAIDYRCLNGAIEADSYTLPKVEEALSSLHGSKFLTSLDMKEAFWSVPLDESCKEYTAFQTPDGLFQYRRMPMGLKTASAVFSRHVDRMLGEMKFTNVLAYIDDLLVFSSTEEEHLNVLGQLFGRLSQFNMTLGAKKCSLFADSVGFLGHIVDREGVKPDQAKMKAIKAMRLEDIQSKQQMESALGLMSYYRKFVANFSSVEKPLRMKCTAGPSAWRRRNGHVVYTKEEHTAFKTLRDALTEDPVLAHPDWEAPSELHCDASIVGLGCVLTQRVGGVERVISYASRSITSAEANYSIWELECLAIVWATRLFRMYLTGSEFKVVTDSSAAAHIIGPKSKSASGRLLRWSLALQDFWPFAVEHRAGKRHGNADGLSRNPLDSTEPYGEGPTEIQPASLLAFRATTTAYFDDVDSTAGNATEFAAHQAKDAWCSMMAKNAKADPAPGDVYAKSGLLLRKARENAGNDQVLVPKCLRAFVLRRYHGLPVSGHLGKRRTFINIARGYYWHGMRRDVARWVAACLTCRRRKTPRPMNAGEPGEVSIATRPWQVVAIDIVSASVKAASGCTKILTILDLFTRYVVAVPLRKANTKEIGGVLFAHLFCRFGKPDRIHSDDGKEFMNKALEALCAKWSITRTTTGGYQPQANPVERYHRFLNSTMTMLSTKFGGEWPDYLPAAIFAYNASTNDATGYMPHELVHGQRPCLLQDLGLEAQLGERPARTPDISQHHRNIGERLQKAYVEVRRRQEDIAAKNRQIIASKRSKRQRGVEYQLDDHVLYWEPRQPKRLKLTPANTDGGTDTDGHRHAAAPAKWKDRWSGPHVITGKVACKTGHRDQFYHRERGQTIETHVNKLCIYRPWSQGLLSTSADLDSKRLYKCGEWVEEDSLVVVPLMKPYPFGIAKVLSTNDDGELELHWLGNTGDSPAGTYLPGWTTKVGSQTYYAVRPRHRTHSAFIADKDNSDISLNQHDVLIHGFELTRTKHLPAPLLRAIAAHPNVWWNPDADNSDGEAREV